MECPYCKGGLKPERTTYTVNRHGDHHLLDDTPAWIWAQCGESVFDEINVEAIHGLLMMVDEDIHLVRQKE